jgi:CRISPR-associated protein Cas5d
MNYPPVEVEVWGEFACFTRPELKAERMSYTMMTPSAARGILESIFWKPEFSWRVREIHVLHPRNTIKQDESDATNFYRHFAIMRNEVDRKATGTPISITDSRVQRHTLALRDVAYLIRADVVLNAHTDADVAKYREQFRRRVNQGQCFARPYLGCREFACDFAPPDVMTAKRRIRHKEPIDLGVMLFDVLRTEAGNIPLFFGAEMRDGVLMIPDALYGRFSG